MKSKNYLSWFLIISAIILLAYLISNKGDFPFAVVTPTSGGQPYTDNPLIIEGTQADSFICNADECIVSGTMVVSKQLGGALAGKWSCFGQPDAKTIFNTETECITKNRLDRDGNQCSNKYCQLISQVVYSANFNFCPQSDVNFPF